jgi:hypothetical protein
MNPVDNQFEDAEEVADESNWPGGMIAQPPAMDMHHQQLVAPAQARQQSPNDGHRDAVSVISSDTFQPDVHFSNLPVQAMSVTVGKSSVSDDSSVENDDMSGPRSHLRAYATTTNGMGAVQMAMPFAMPSGVSEEDVLCGRGKGANNFIGNRRFRELVMNFRETYANSPRRADKRSICRKIIDTVHGRQGRFLSKNEIDGQWVELDRPKILIKVSQALREGVAKWNKATQKHKESKAKIVASLSHNPAMALLAEISSIRSNELAR